MRNPKHSFSSHLCEYMSDEEFPKATMMKILRAKIALNSIVQKKQILVLTMNILPLLIVKIKLWQVWRKHIVNILPT